MFGGLRKIGLYVFLVVALANFVYAVECGSTPTDGCEVTQDTIFNPAIYELPEGIVINNSNIMLDCNNATLTGPPNWYWYGPAITVVHRSNILIKNCRINNYAKGIYLVYSNDNKIFNITIENIRGMNWREEIDGTGIYLNFSNNNIIHSINISKVEGAAGCCGYLGGDGYQGGIGAGVRLFNSNNNKIINNSISYVTGGEGGRGTGYAGSVSYYLGGQGGVGSAIYSYSSDDNLFNSNYIYKILGGRGGGTTYYNMGGDGGVGSGIYVGLSDKNVIESNYILNISGGVGGLGSYPYYHSYDGGGGSGKQL